MTELKYNKNLDKGAANVALDMVLSTANALANQSFLQKTSYLFNVIGNEDVEGIKEILGSSIPVGALNLLKGSNELADIGIGKRPISYKPEGFKQSFLNQIGVTSGIKENVDVSGQTKYKSYTRFPVGAIDLFRKNKNKENQLAKLLLDAGIRIGDSKTVDNRTYKSTLWKMLEDNYSTLKTLDKDKLTKLVDRYKDRARTETIRKEQQ